MDDSVQASLQYLLKSTLQSLKIISNYRSFLSLNAAFYLQKNPHTEQQMRQLYDDILSDYQQQFYLLQRLSSVIVRVPSYSQYYALLTNIEDELLALNQDAAATSLISSYVLHFSLKSAPVIPDAVSVLLSGAGNATSAGNAEVYQLYRTLLEEQYASLALQKQLKFYYQYSSTYKASNPKSADRMMALESENQLLSENIADLRRSLEQIQQENRTSKEVMYILKQNIQADNTIRAQLYESNNKLSAYVQELQQRSFPEAQLQAVQLIFRQILTASFAYQFDGAAFHDGTGILELQQNASNTLGLVLRMKAGIEEAERERDAGLRKIAQLQYECERVSEVAQKMSDELALRQYPEETQETKTQLLQAREETQYLRQQLQSMQNELEQAKYPQIAEQQNESEQMTILKQNFKQAIYELRQQIMNVYAALKIEPVKGEEFELNQVCSRCAELIVISEYYANVRSELKHLSYQGGDINAELERICYLL